MLIATVTTQFSISNVQFNETFSFIGERFSFIKTVYLELLRLCDY